MLQRLKEALVSLWIHMKRSDNIYEHLICLCHDCLWIYNITQNLSQNRSKPGETQVSMADVTAGAMCSEQDQTGEHRNYVGGNNT